METVYIVETKSGLTDHGDAFVFDSVWDDEAACKRYCKRFKTMGGFGTPWPYTITPVQINKGS